jgi:hypothetical protein
MPESSDSSVARGRSTDRRVPLPPGRSAPRFPPEAAGGPMSSPRPIGKTRSTRDQIIGRAASNQDRRQELREARRSAEVQLNIDRAPDGRLYLAQRDARANAQRRIDEFREAQRREWRLVDFSLLAEWYVHATGHKSEDARTRLRRAVELGDFESEGESRVLFLHPALIDETPIDPANAGLPKMTRARLQNAVAIFQSDHPHALDTVWNQHLAHCWLYREDAERWFKYLNLPIPGVLLEAAATGAAAIGTPSTAAVEEHADEAVGYAERGEAARRALVALKLLPNYAHKRHREIADELLRAVVAEDPRLESGWVKLLKDHYGSKEQRSALERQISRLDSLPTERQLRL